MTILGNTETDFGNREYWGGAEKTLKVRESLRNRGNMKGIIRTSQRTERNKKRNTKRIPTYTEVTRKRRGDNRGNLLGMQEEMLGE